MRSESEIRPVVHAHPEQQRPERRDQSREAAVGAREHPHDGDGDEEQRQRVVAVPGVVEVLPQSQ